MRGYTLIVSCSLFVCTLSAIPTTSAQTWTESDKLFAGDASPDSVFGHAISVSSDAAIVGAYRNDQWRGAAYVLSCVNGAWVQETKLTASDAAADDCFGWSAAISGSLAVAGAYGDDDAGSQSGSAYVFERLGDQWSQTAKLTDADAATIDGFGISAVILGASTGSSEAIFIGAPFDDEPALDCGSVCVFERRDGRWTQTGKITASDADSQDRFGISVAASGDWLLVGAYFDDERGEDAGAAYLFHLEQGQWIQHAKLTADPPGARDEFGYAVALEGGTAMVGARYHDAHGGDSGAVYVFTEANGAWTQTATLTPDDAAAFARFGDSVAKLGDVAIIGADHDDDRGTSSGAAYVFRRTGDAWIQQSKLIGHDTSAGDEAGHAVALSTGSALVGARLDDDWGMDSGSVFVFRPDTACSGHERIKRAACSSRDGVNTLKVSLRGGAAGDAFGLLLSTGDAHHGTLDDRGRAKVRFRRLPAGDGTVIADWGCGSTAGLAYTCP